jgi:hypothetical protein
MSSKAGLEPLMTELHQILLNLSEGKESPETPNHLTRVTELLQQIASLAKSHRDLTFPAALIDLLHNGNSIKDNLFQELYKLSVDRQRQIENLKSLKINFNV